MALIEKNQIDETARLVKMFSKTDREKLRRVIKALRDQGVNFELKSEERKKILISYQQIDLELVIQEEIDSVPEQIRLNDMERRVVFHGTKSDQVQNLRNGFFSVSPTYKVFSKDIHSSLNFKTGLMQEVVSDGTITIWTPPRDQLREGDRVHYSIINPKPKELEVPTSLAGPKNSRKDEYDFAIAPEHFIGVVTFNNEQKVIIAKARKLLEELTIDSSPENLEELIDLNNFFGSELQTSWMDVDQSESNQNRIDLIKTIFVMMHESELKRRALRCEYPDKKNIESFVSFPTFEIAGYERYKKEKLDLLGSLIKFDNNLF